MTVKEEQVIKKRKAQHALEEIFESEKKYVDKLNSIVESLMMPALQNSSVFSSSEIALLFGNIVELRNLHSKMFSKFADSDSQQPEKLAKIISEELPQFSIAYHQYCSNFPRATRLYSKIRKNSKMNFQNAKCDSSSTLRRISKSPSDSISSSSLPSPSDRLENSSFPTLRRTNTLLFRSTSAVFRRHTLTSGKSVQNLNEAGAGNTVNFLKRKLSPRKSSPGGLFPLKKEDPEISRANLQCEFLQKSLESSTTLDSALPLIAFLLEPIQRVMRYPLLLKGLSTALESPIPEVKKAIEAADKLASITNITQPNSTRPGAEEKENKENRSPTGSEVSIPACVPKPDKKRKSFEVVCQAAVRLLRSR
ncbi:Oidioi.mRNA.OKI2018_I69.chr2.g4491.t1.cds [Oikopleura dioica]|uniref:Oidioi.mRNA.OKI2018_I69.chr2.g4491.t1.cds n=1 Tax=Oikopleura dioica TaxID=34765 RepID=A0ABN7SXK2_OIKDI|nr:Oidioi.mRNA.OKI2018_I69.chr2.g4491.t1.cds [Oikopleura dioica]